MEELNEYNNKFPKTNEECLTLIHRNKTLRLLRNFIEKIGLEMYEKLCKEFP